MTNLGGTAVPIPAIGEHFSEGLYVARCILGFAATTASGSEGYDRWTDTAEVVPIFDINATDIVVHQVYADVEVAWTASVDLSIGDGANAAGFAAVAQLAATVISSGMIADTVGNVYGGGKWYKSTDSIDVTVASADPLVGKMSVYAVYSHGAGLPVPDSGGSSNT